MTANGKIQVTIAADSKDSVLDHNEVLVADVIVRALDVIGYSLLEIRMLMPESRAEDLLLRMLLSKAEFSLKEISPMVAADE